MTKPVSTPAQRRTQWSLVVLSGVGLWIGLEQGARALGWTRSANETAIDGIEAPLLLVIVSAALLYLAGKRWGLMELEREARRKEIMGGASKPTGQPGQGTT